jgi:hypothetical protein
VFGVLFLGNFSRIAVLLLIISGIIAYLRAGAGLFEQVKNSGLRLQIGTIDRALELEKQTRRRYPKDFVAFARKEFGQDGSKDAATDPWGQFYHFEQIKNGFRLSSAGADGHFSTADDIVWERSNGVGQFVDSQQQHSSISLPTKPLELNGSEDPLMAQIELLLSAASSDKDDEEDLNRFIARFLEQNLVE